MKTSVMMAGAAAAVFVGAVAVHANRAAAPAIPASTITIRVDADNGAPDRVSFDGAGPFEPRTGGFEGTKTFQGRFALYDLAIVYGDYEMPLRLIGRAGGDSTLPLRVYRAVYASCEAGDVADVAGAPGSGTIDTQVRTLMRAHRLLENNACPEPEKRKLTRAYYRLSCALAGTPHSAVVISPDAQARFEAMPGKTPADTAMLTNCTGKGLAAPLQLAWKDLQDAKERGDVDGFAALSGELLDHATDPNWSAGFKAVGIDADHVRASQVDELYDRQIAAFHARDGESAIALNTDLIELKKNNDYAGAFSAVSITDGRLSADRVAIEGMVIAPR